MGDLVDETVRGIRARLKELAPAMAEYERLQAAYEALDSLVLSPRAASGWRRGEGRAAALVGSERVRVRAALVRAPSAVRIWRRCSA